MVSFSKFVIQESPDVVYRFGACFINASHNKLTAYKHLNLRWTIGSLGLSDHFEYGGRNHTVKDYYENPFKSHAWLEDEHGNVYDYIFPEYEEFVINAGKTPTFTTDWLIEGISKADLLEDGIEYIPAPKKALPDLLDQIDQITHYKFPKDHSVFREAVGWKR